VDPKRPNEPPVIQEFFTSDQPPLNADQDLVVKLFIDKFSGLRASPECNNDTSNTEQKEFVTVNDPFALKWLEQDEQGKKWAEILKIKFPVTAPPTEFCNPSGARPTVNIISPTEGQTLDGIVDIIGVADVSNDEFHHYIVDWGIGNDPGGWATISGEVTTPVKESGLLAKWDTKDIPNGEATIRVMVFDKRGSNKEARVHVFIQHPATETPVPTDTSVPPTETPTSAPTATPAPTNTVEATATATNAPPTETQTPTATLEPPTATSSETPTETPTTGP
jgi:hypothetical protein